MIQLRGLHPQLRPYAEYAIQVANAYGLRPVVTSVYRTIDEQRRLHERYRRGLTSYPANRPGDSAHNYGLAFDSWVPDQEMGLWQQIRAMIGWRVPQNDLIHAELPEWRRYVA